jgi:antitoxin component of RelBE/YafQ-DinJ toxin-antitoxin module
MNTTLTIKIDRRLRDDAKKAADELGIPLTTVVNGMLRKFSRDKEITFSVYPTPKPEKLAEWEKTSADMDAHPEKYKVYESVEEFLAHMNDVWKKEDRKRKRHSAA